MQIMNLNDVNLRFKQSETVTWFKPWLTLWDWAQLSDHDFLGIFIHQSSQAFPQCGKVLKYTILSKAVGVIWYFHHLECTQCHPLLIWNQHEPRITVLNHGFGLDHIELIIRGVQAAGHIGSSSRTTPASLMTHWSGNMFLKNLCLIDLRYSCSQVLVFGTVSVWVTVWVGHRLKLSWT